jgi:hypothetical protein
MCVHTLGWSLLHCPRSERLKHEVRLPRICDVAINDMSHPELRRGACVAAFFLGGYEARIHELSRDESMEDLGLTVASAATEWDLPG